MKTLFKFAGTLLLSTLIYSCDKNEFAPEVADQEFTIAENSPPGSVVGTVIASDADDGQTVSFEIIDGNINSTFALDPSSGILSVSNPADLNYEEFKQITLTISVSDSHSKEPMASSAKIQVNISDVNEFAPEIADQVFSIEENSQNGTAIGTVVATDRDEAQILSFEITDGNDAGTFELNPNSGLLSIKDSAQFNYEINNQFILEVTATDNHEDSSLESTATITIDVLDIIEFLQGQIASYPFEGNADDASGHGHNGTVHGAVLSLGRNGTANSAYYFNGNLAYIDLGNSNELKRYKSDYTVCGWIKLDEYPPTYNSIILSNRNHLISSKPGSFIGVGGLFSSLSKRIEFVQNTVVTSDEFTFDYMSSNTQLDLDSWYFFAVTYEYNGNLENNIKIYINGSLESQKLMGEVIDPGNAPTYLGCEPELSPVQYSFNGSMDDIEFYNRALTETEILTLFNN